MPKKRQEGQRNLFIINNQNLFSNNYLQHKLPETNLWRDYAANATEAFEKLKQSYRHIEHMNLGRGEERNLEERFIGPVLEALGYSYDVQPITQRGTRKKRPDYALFKSEDHLREARAHKDNFKRFFSSVLTILETKYWGRRLNDTDVNDTLDSRDPTAQTIKYLEL